MMLTIYKRTDHITNLIVLFITFYEITEIIVYSLKFDFYKYATNISEIYADHRTIYFKLVVAFYITIISYIVIASKDKIRKFLVPTFILLAIVLIRICINLLRKINNKID